MAIKNKGGVKDDDLYIAVLNHVEHGDWVEAKVDDLVGARDIVEEFANEANVDEYTVYKLVKVARYERDNSFKEVK